MIYDMMDSLICNFYGLEPEDCANKLDYLAENKEMCGLFVVFVAMGNRLDKKDKALKILNDGGY